MALLLNTATQKATHLLPHHTFGRRADKVDSALEGEEISKLHAVIEWRGDSWCLKDISRNGCWINEEKLNAHQEYTLKIGQVIRFGAAEQHSFQVQNIDEPKPMLLGMNPETTDQEIGNYHLLPNDDKPQAAIFYSQPQQSFIFEYLNFDAAEESDQQMLSHLELIELPPYCWCLFDSHPEKATVDINPGQTAPAMRDIMWRFNVSLDEEHIFIQLEEDDKTCRLGERSHHYLLLHLARIFHEHQKQGTDLDNCGWVDIEQLSKDLGLDSNHLNIQVFRARKQISNAFNLSDHLQRRRGQLRLLCPKICIQKGDALELEQQTSSSSA